MDSNALNFAYKYPFSNEAKEIVGTQSSSINPKYLNLSANHIDNILNNSLDYKEISISSIQLDYIMTYLYSRMILSASKRVDLIKKYALAEARRSANAIAFSNTSELLKISSELGVRITERFNKNINEIEELAISFTDYVSNAPNKPEFELVNQKLNSGIVLLDKNKMSKVIENIIFREILKGLPIKSSDLPKEVVDYSKTIKFKMPFVKITAKAGSKSTAWIERLLQTPISDIRHRTVNLILAPYLVNTKGLEVEQATKIINDYIEKCKEIDPDTKINERYIQYQCTYAKKRGLKPLSFERAKELLGSAIDDDASK